MVSLLSIDILMNKHHERDVQSSPCFRCVKDLVCEDSSRVEIWIASIVEFGDEMVFFSVARSDKSRKLLVGCWLLLISH